jgi:hypothetical protein
MVRTWGGPHAKLGHLSVTQLRACQGRLVDSAPI